MPTVIVSCAAAGAAIASSPATAAQHRSAPAIFISPFSSPRRTIAGPPTAEGELFCRDRRLGADPRSGLADRGWRDLHVPHRLNGLAFDRRHMRLDIEQRRAARAIIFDITPHGVAPARRRQFGEFVLVDAGVHGSILVVAVGGAEILVAFAAGDGEAVTLLDDIQAFMDAH